MSEKPTALEVDADADDAAGEAVPHEEVAQCDGAGQTPRSEHAMFGDPINGEAEFVRALCAPYCINLGLRLAAHERADRS